MARHAAPCDVVKMNQHPLWYLMSVQLRSIKHLSRFISAYQKRPT